MTIGQPPAPFSTINVMAAPFRRVPDPDGDGLSKRTRRNEFPR
jgi:hypothetical protein